MKYTKNDEKIEYYAFGICFIITFFGALQLKGFLAEIITNESAYIIVLALLSLMLNWCILFKNFSKYFFKIPVIKNKIVNFNGEWEGDGESSYKSNCNGITNYSVKIIIKQTLTEISINATFKESQSEAINCSILKENNKEKLIYNYFNNPNNTGGLDKHYGTIVLEKTDKDKLKGSYFTDREPQTKGDFNLKFKNHGTS